MEESSAPADDSNPYSAIIRANVFHLNEAPKPIEKPDVTLASLPKVNISGFVRHGDEPVRALFATIPKDPKDQPRYFNLAEGEKDDFLELRKISENQESVEVVLAGTAITLTTKSNSFVQPLPPAKPGGPVPAANIGQNPVVAHPNPVIESGSTGGVIVAGGVAPVAASGSTSVTTIGSGVNSMSGGGTSFGSPSGGNPTAVSYNSPANSALQPVPVRGAPSAPSFPQEYHPASYHESAALMLIDSQVHDAEIKAGRYPPPPPMPR